MNSGQGLAFVIAGHQRSGTSALRRTLSTHPEISLAREFGCYLALERPLLEHCRFITKRLFERRSNPFSKEDIREKSSRRVRYAGSNVLFVARYLGAMLRHDNGPITAGDINTALRSALRTDALIGDKYPDYWYYLPLLAAEPLITLIVIIRDPRDMVASVLESARGDWGRYWPQGMQNTTAVVRNWVNLVELVRRCENRVHIVRYEEFVSEPKVVLARLAGLAGLSTIGFDTSKVHTHSVGSFRQRLTDEELAQVVAVAGQQMDTLGYDRG